MRYRQHLLAAMLIIAIGFQAQPVQAVNWKGLGIKLFFIAAPVVISLAGSALAANCGGKTTSSGVMSGTCNSNVYFEGGHIYSDYDWDFDVTCRCSNMACFPQDARVTILTNFNEDKLVDVGGGTFAFTFPKKHKQRRKIEPINMPISQLLTGHWIVVGEKDANTIYVAKVGKFMEHQPTVETAMAVISHVGGKITMSPNHRLYLSNNGRQFDLGTPVDVKNALDEGRAIFVQSQCGKAMKVTGINVAKTRGVYAPLVGSNSGELAFIVNGVKVSCSTSDGNVCPQDFAQIAESSGIAQPVYKESDVVCPDPTLVNGLRTIKGWGDAMVNGFNDLREMITVE